MEKDSKRIISTAISEYLLANIQNLLFSSFELNVETNHVNIILYHNAFNKAVLNSFLYYYVADTKAESYDIKDEVERTEAVKSELRSYTTFDNRRVEELIMPFMKGYILAKKINQSLSKNILFMEFLFVPPQNFDAIIKNIDNGKRLTLLLGAPKTGKTYSAYFIIYRLIESQEYDIHYCVSPAKFESLIKILSVSNKNKKTFIYYEDPYGFSGQHDADILARVNNILTRIPADKNIHVLYTSRKQLYLSSKADDNLLNNDTQIVNYHFEKPLSTERQSNEANVYYDIDKIKEILLRIGQLYNARWIGSFHSYVRNKDKKWLWDIVLDYSKLSPGNIFECFVIYRSLREFDVNDMHKIQWCLESGVNDLMKAFNSEISLFMKREDDQFSKKLLFTLPAFTTLDSKDDIREIFKDVKGLNDYLDIFIERKDDDTPFAKRTVVYYHPTFAETIQDYLFKHGAREFLTDSRILKFVRNHTLEQLLIRDIICFCYYLIYIERNKRLEKNTIRALQEDNDILNELIDLRKHYITEPKLIIQIQIVQFFYDDYGINENDIKEYLNNAVKDKAPETIAFICSVIEHQISLVLTRLKEHDKFLHRIKHFITVVTDISLEDSSDGINVLLSALMHTIFANIEYLMMEEGSLISRTIRKSLNRIAHEPSRHQLNTSIIWMDAIIMKFSELHQYSKECEMILKKLNAPGEIEANPNYSNDINRIQLKEEKDSVDDVINELFGHFLTHWTSLHEKDTDKTYLLGGLTFTLLWHNRWQFDKGYDNIYAWLDRKSITNHIKNAIDSVDTHERDSFRAGFMYNMNYHYRYFMVRKKAWQRENSIMIWKTHKPRKGADALYESGIIDRQGVKIKRPGILGPDEERKYLNNLLLDLIEKKDEEGVENFLYLLGLRYEKNEMHFSTVFNTVIENKVQIQEALDNAIITLKEDNIKLFATKIDEHN